MIFLFNKLALKSFLTQNLPKDIARLSLMPTLIKVFGKS